MPIDCIGKGQPNHGLRVTATLLSSDTNASQIEIAKVTTQLSWKRCTFPKKRCEEKFHNVPWCRGASDVSANCRLQSFKKVRESHALISNEDNGEITYVTMDWSSRPNPSNKRPTHQTPKSRSRCRYQLTEADQLTCVCPCCWWEAHLLRFLHWQKKRVSFYSEENRVWFNW